jgi:hypothetical protein
MYLLLPQEHHCISPIGDADEVAHVLIVWRNNGKESYILPTRLEEPAIYSPLGQMQYLVGNCGLVTCQCLAPMRHASAWLSGGCICMALCVKSLFLQPKKGKKQHSVSNCSINLTAKESRTGTAVLQCCSRCGKQALDVARALVAETNLAC